MTRGSGRQVLGLSRERRRSSSSMPARMMDKRSSPSPRTASRRSTVSFVRGSVNRSVHCFGRPRFTSSSVSYV